MFIVVSRFPFTSKKCIIIIYIFRMARYNSHPNWHENLEQWTSQRSNWGMVDVLWLEQRSVPIFGSKGHCLFIQGKGVSREAGNTTTNIQNLNYPVEQISLISVVTFLNLNQQHYSLVYMTKTNILTQTQNIEVIKSHTYKYIYIHIHVCLCI